jgi:cyanate permease
MGRDRARNGGDRSQLYRPLDACGGYIGGTVSPIVIGFVVDMTGSFVIALGIGAAITILGAVILQFLVRSQITSDDLEASAVAVPAE